MSAFGLEGRRILVVEDSPVIAVVIEDMLKELGCEVVGPTGSMAVGLELAASETLDAAVIDLNVRGGKIYPVAEILRDRDIPFVIASGYADWTLPDEWRDRPRVTKPYTIETVEKALKGLFGAQ